MELIHKTESRCNADYKIYGIDEANQLFAGRDIYIWGAGLKGRGFQLALERNGFEVKAFLDSNTEFLGEDYQGTPILHPDDILGAGDAKETAFILTATVDTKNKVLFKACEAAGLERGIDFENIQTLSPFYPTIEITGICNLRCRSCPRGNPEDPPDIGGYMSLEDYSKVIHKMLDEIPFLYLIDLYVWGEPILNSELPDIIRLNKSLGLESGISTNLNNNRNLERVIEAGPAQIRVSLSGASAETYEVTHAGGKWKAVYNNLHRLRGFMDQHNSQTIVEVYYHLYKHNIHEYMEMEKLCEDLKFKLSPVLAMLFPDYAMDHSEGRPLNEETQKVHDLMLLDLDKLLDDARKDDLKKCLLTRILPVINADLSVLPCCNYSYQKLGDNYLEIGLQEIIDRRNTHSLCQNCQSHSMHRYFNPVKYTDYVNEVIQAARGKGVALEEKKIYVDAS